MNLILRQKWTLMLAAVVTIGMQTTWAQQRYYTGDGGKGVRLAVLEPVGKGLSADEQWILSLVQGSITGDFNRFSAMTIIDRQNLEKVFSEWEEAMSENYSDEDCVRFGNLTNASHILTGSISKTANAFMLELTVTDVASGERKASYPPTPVSLLALENLSAIKTASAELLRQLGVELTATALGELKRVANTARLQAETMLARGIAAQRQGTEVAALSYFFQAAALDSSLLEASKRSSVMAANISSGNIGADVRNDIVWRKNWVARLKETEETFYNMINIADPPFTLFYSTDIQTGNIDYQKETADLSINIHMSANKAWFTAIERAHQAVDAILDGLNATNRKDVWGLAGWPREGVSNTNPFATTSSWKQYDITVTFELVNEMGRVIGAQAVMLNPGFNIAHNDNGKVNIAPTDDIYGTVNFNRVTADDISDNLTIRIVSVNGGSPENARFAIFAAKSIEMPVPKPSTTESRNTALYKPKNKVSLGVGGFFASNYGGGLNWSNGEAVAMPNIGGGAYLFFDAIYAEIFVGYSTSGGKWESATATRSGDLPDMQRTYGNVGLFAKYPISAGSIKFFPLLGVDYDASISGKLIYENGNEVILDDISSAVWFKLGVGFDTDLGRSAYWRIEILYGWRTANDFEKEMQEQESFYSNYDVKTRSGSGLTLKTGLGFRF